METILNFLVDNYLWFLIISLILIFGLIGYIVDSREKKTPKLHFGDEEEKSTVSLNTDDEKSLKELLAENDQVVEGINISDENSEITPIVVDDKDNNQETIQNELPKE